MSRLVSARVSRRGIRANAPVGLVALVAATAVVAMSLSLPGMAAGAITTPAATATAAPSPTEGTAPTASPAPPPSPTSTTEPTSSSPAPSTTPSPTPTPSASAPAAVPPAATSATIDVAMLTIAGVTLIGGALLLWVLLRRSRRESRDSAPPTAKEPPAVVLDAMASLGAEMIDCGYPVGPTRSALDEMARSHGLSSAQAVVFPTSILVSSGAQESVQTRVVTAGETSALLYQVDAIDRIAGVARRGIGAASWVLAALEHVHTMPAPFSRAQRAGAYALLSAALSVLLGSSWPGVALAAILGTGVGVLLLGSERLDTVRRALIVVTAALGVAIVVLLVARYVDPGVLPVAVAPLVMLLPGGLLTIGVIELATGDIMSGAARVAAGAMRLLLLSAGLVAAGALVGVPSVATSHWPLGPVMPWIAVAAFGIGIGVYQCARPMSIGWVIVVLYVAYAAQVIGDVFFDGVLSALVGAAAMTPVAVVVARLRTGPPAFVSFLPAFWLLVPGALGLIGAADMFEGDSSGMGTLVTTVATMVSVALGVLIGMAATGSVHGLRNAPPEAWMRRGLDVQPRATEP